MNKTKKIVAVAVSVVMAGTLAASLTACKPGDDGGSLTPKLDENGKLTYAQNTTLNTAIGYQDSKTGIKYDNDLQKNAQNYLGDSGATFTLYGKTYSSGLLKPAWQTLADTLGVTITDDFAGVKTDEQMKNITGQTGGLKNHQLFTASANDINKQGAAGALLNITDYLEYMPNYKAFLDANPLTRLSLTADEVGSMYMLPYFDGNDDIEKYVILEKNLVEILLDTANLDGNNTITFKAQADAKNGVSANADKGIVGTSTSVKSFMGTTGSWKVETTAPSALSTETEDAPVWGNNLNVAKIAKGEGATTKVVVNYDDAKTAATNPETPLGDAIKTAANGTVYNGTSGNIVDLQNFAINARDGEVKGNALLKILREYIKVAYQTESGTAFYTKLSDVFNSAYAAWDVDLYVALGRCFTTCGDLLQVDGQPLAKDAKELYLLTGREYKANRYSDVYAMAGELYGVRGLETRYSPTYAYINAEGKISDSRLDTKMWEALDNMNKLAKEGLLNAMTTDNIKNGWTSSGLSDQEHNTGLQALSLHDYVQTQTANTGFETEAGNLDASYSNFAPVLTPVSHWDTTGDGTVTTMRFTESWRGVKNTGWCISKSAVKGKPDKLSAALALVDYFFSNDGQILMTYGPQATNGNDNGSVTASKTAGNGFWYGNKVNMTLEQAIEDKIVVTNDGVQYYANPGEKNDQGELVNVYDDQYFVYKNVLYTGSYYKGRQIPTLTDSSLTMFKGTLGKKSFTNYARHYIGSALNIGNKDQGFEYQCTAKCGIVGADIVNIALVNGTIKHTLQLSPEEAQANNNWWYMLTPTLLPYETDVTNIITVSPYTLVTALSGTSLFSVSGSTPNLLNDVMAFGLGSDHLIRTMSNQDKIPATAADVIKYLDEKVGGDDLKLMTNFQTYMNEAWQIALTGYAGTNKDQTTEQ